MPTAVLTRTREKMLGLYMYKLSCIFLLLVCALSLLRTAVSSGAASCAVCPCLSPTGLLARV